MKQKLETEFVWNTDSVEKGAKKIDASYEKVTKSAKKSGHENANLIQGFKDLGSGRTLYGMQRLSNHFKGMAVTLGIAGAGLYGVSKAISITREEMRKTNEEGRRLDETFSKISRSARFSTAGEGFGSLAGKRQSLIEQQQGERAQQGRISDIGAGTDANAMSRTFWDLYQKARGSDIITGLFGESKSMKTEKTESELRGRYSSAAELEMLRLQKGALGNESMAARLSSGPSGEASSFEARRHSLNVQRETELAEIAKERGSDDKAALDLVKQKYSWLTKAVNAEEAIALAKNKQALAELKIRGGAGSDFSKSLSGATGSVKLSTGLLNSGLLTAEQDRAERIVLESGRSQQIAALSDRYIDPVTGRKRRGGVIQREFRAERNATRRRNAFRRRIDAGEFDMMTGRKTGGQTASGLMSGGLSSGGLTSGGLAAAFPAKIEAPKASTEANDYLAKILGVLGERLPKETH